ncbi:MAG: MBL fold metallo-hydrolase [Coriobacteriaceae bacterium]|nr:MBL fold metallo-hydrolase [Coriobacteriaceae bacterium]
MKTNVKLRKALWESGHVTPSLFGVRADNITPMTVVGTNTFIVNAPGSPKALVVDPGPPDVLHLRKVMAACADRNAEIAGILVTHHHLDHIAGTDLLRHLIAHGPESIDPDNVPATMDGTRFRFNAFGNYPLVVFPEEGVPVYHTELGNLPEGPFAPFEGCPAMEIVALPGHSYDMVGLILNDEQVILTGDLIFRYWSTVIPYGDGNLGDYFRSLNRLQRLVRAGVVTQFVPAHGFPIDQPIKALEGYRAHRKERLAEVTRIVDGGAGFDPDAVVAGVYGNIDDPMLLRASLASTVTQLEYLAEQRGGEFSFDPREFNRRFPNLGQT